MAGWIVVSATSNTLERFLETLQNSLEPYLGRIAYGNLRKEVSEWSSDGTHSTNLALGYESPGGSTDQINVAFDHKGGLFHITNEHGDEVTPDPEVVANAVMLRVEAIPAKRAATLRRCVNEWLGEGRSRGQMFVEANRLLQSGFRGGSITHEELKDVIRYIVDCYDHRGTYNGTLSE